MESPWYVRELTRCQLGEDTRFDSISAPCVLYPLSHGGTVVDVAIGETGTNDPNSNTPARSERPSRDIIALDIRQRIVALLLAKGIDAPGRWLDVYAAEAVDDTRTYVIIPARKLKHLIAKEIAALIDRTLNDEETRWILYGEEVEKLLGSSAAKLRTA
jgi:hypothetical protein